MSNHNKGIWLLNVAAKCVKDWLYWEKENRQFPKCSVPDVCWVFWLCRWSGPEPPHRLVPEAVLNEGLRASFTGKGWSVCKSISHDRGSTWLVLLKGNQLKTPHKLQTAGDIDIHAIYTQSLHLEHWCSLLSLKSIFFLVLCIFKDWSKAMLKPVFWFKNWQLCFSGTVQILQSREKDMMSGWKKKKKKLPKNGRWIAAWFNLYAPS